MIQIFDYIFTYFNQYQTIPTPDNLATYIHTQNFLSDEDKALIRKIMYDCIIKADNYTIEFLRNEMTEWIRVGRYKKAMWDFKSEYKKRNVKSLYQIMQVCQDDVRDLDFNADGTIEFGDPLKDIEELKVESTRVLTTGITVLDEMLEGGLRRKEHTVLVGPLNIGKSTVLYNMIRENVKLGHDVLIITHEMNPLDVKIKIKQSFLKATKKEYMDLIHDENGMKWLIATEQILQKKLCYYPYHKAGGLYVEDVVDIVRRKNEEHKAKTGKYYDLLVDDYPAKLLSREFKSIKDKRHTVAYCYEQFHQLALEYDMHAISPMQLNRDGVKRNRTREENDFITGDNVAEAHQVMHDASNAIIINRSMEDEVKNQMFFYIDKSRSSKKNFVIKVNTDFSRALAFHKELGWELYEENSATAKDLQTKTYNQIMLTGE